MSTSPLAFDPVPSPSTDHVADDWIPLLDAVRERLCRLAGASSADGAARAALQACLGDCLLALDQAHTELRLEVEHRHRLELDLFDARLALARVTWPQLHALNFDRCLQP